MKHLLAVALVSLVTACCSAPANPPPVDVPPPEPTPVVTPPAGPIEAPAVMCGGIAARPCAVGEFCDVADHCGAGDQSGVCTVIPQMCTRDYRPVCGCDGKTYGNRCTAHAAGVSVARPGECAAP